MNPLRFHIDQFDEEGLGGWVDDGGPVSPVVLLINGSPTTNVDATLYRSDLQAAGLGDGRRCFHIQLEEHLRPGLNRVMVKARDEIIHDRFLFSGSFAELNLALPPEHRQPIDPDQHHGFVTPADGTTISPPHCCVVARFGGDGGKVVCRVVLVDDYIHKGPGQSEVLCETALQPLPGNAGLFWGYVGGLAVGQHYVFVLSAVGRPIVAGVLVSTSMTSGWSALSTSGDGSVAAPCIVGPLHFAKASCSNFPAADEILVDFKGPDGPDDAQSDIRQDNGYDFLPIYPAESVDGLPAFDTELSFGDGLSRSELVGETAWTSAAGYFCGLSNVKLFPATGFTLFEDRYIWGNSRVPVGHLDPLYKKITGSFWIGDQFYIGIPEHRVFAETIVPVILHINPNYAHWLLNSVTAAWHARRIFGERTLFVLPKASQLMIDSLLCLGIGRNSILEVSEPVCALHRAIYPSLINTHSSTFPSPHNFGAMQAITSAVDKLTSRGNSPKRIRITRKGGPVSVARVIENEEELEERLGKLGFVTVRLHEYDFVSQVKLFRNAEIIIAPTGAGLTNMAFAPAGSAIIEICSSQPAYDDWLRIAYWSGHRYIRVRVRPSSEIDFAGGYKLKAPIEQICEIVRWLERG